MANSERYGYARVGVTSSRDGTGYVDRGPLMIVPEMRSFNLPIHSTCNRYGIENEAI